MSSQIRLCCNAKTFFRCRHCKDRMCYEHGKPYENDHFMIDMCRSRFAKEELVLAVQCYKDRIRGMGLTKRFGDCFICTVHQRGVRDRIVISQPESLYAPNPDQIVTNLRKIWT